VALLIPDSSCRGFSQRIAAEFKSLHLHYISYILYITFINFIYITYIIYISYISNYILYYISNYVLCITYII